MTTVPLLLTPAQLDVVLRDHDVLVLDVRLRYEGETAHPDAERYRAGHVPGAVFADLVGELSAVHPERQFVLPDPERFAAAIGAIGVDADRHVVVYTEGWPIWATRLWWLLRYYGHERVSVLDGGWQGWTASGREVEVGENPPSARSFVPSARPELLASLDEVAAISAGEVSGRLVNALPAAMFTGETATHGTVFGRIPGSVNIPWPTVAGLESGVFHDVGLIDAATADTLAGEAGAAGTVAYCGGGVSATGLIFGLALAGRDDVRLYDGSMDEWAADPGRPLERG